MMRASDVEGSKKEASIAGATEVVVQRAHIVVSNSAGRLCHIKATSEYSCPPQTCAKLMHMLACSGSAGVLLLLLLPRTAPAASPAAHMTRAVWQCSVYSILVNPDNTKLFRDIHAVTSRTITREEKDLKVIEASFACSQALRVIRLCCCSSCCWSSLGNLSTAAACSPC